MEAQALSARAEGAERAEGEAMKAAATEVSRFTTGRPAAAHVTRGAVANVRWQQATSAKG